MASFQGEKMKSDLYFCPEGNVARLIRRGDISSEKREAIRSLHELDKRWNRVILLYFALWFAGAWVGVVSNVLVINLLCYCVAGGALSTLTVLAHESTHNLFTHKPKIDRWIGFLCSLPLLLSPTGYRERHPLHHKRLKTAEDPDDLEQITQGAKMLSVLYIVMLFVGAYLFLFDTPVQAYRRGSPGIRRAVVLEYAAILSLHGAGWFLLSPPVMVEAWLIPMLIAVQVANIRGIAEHGLTSSGSELIDTRTVKVHPVLSFLMCNINYHLEHHLYPGVPWYNLPRLHRIIADELREAGSSVYTSYREFLVDVFKALKNGVVPGRRLIPAHLREEVCL